MLIVWVEEVGFDSHGLGHNWMLVFRTWSFL